MRTDTLDNHLLFSLFSISLITTRPPREQKKKKKKAAIQAQCCLPRVAHLCFFLSLSSYIHIHLSFLPLFPHSHSTPVCLSFCLPASLASLSLLNFSTISPSHPTLSASWTSSFTSSFSFFALLRHFLATIALSQRRLCSKTHDRNYSPIRLLRHVHCSDSSDPPNKIHTLYTHIIHIKFHSSPIYE